MTKTIYAIGQFTIDSIKNGFKSAIKHFTKIFQRFGFEFKLNWVDKWQIWFSILFWKNTCDYYFWFCFIKTTFALFYKNNKK